jgi:hypothetical protein
MSSVPTEMVAVQHYDIVKGGGRVRRRVGERLEATTSFSGLGSNAGKSG